MPRVRTALGATALAAASAAGAHRAAGRRSARITAELNRAHAEALARVPTTDEVVVSLLADRRSVPPRAVRTPISDRVHARLAPTDIADVEAAIDEGLTTLYAGADPATRRRITLNFAAAYGLESVLSRARMVAAMPPGEVHAMARGPVAAGGDFYLADLVFDALDHAGIEVPRGGTVLDFGASSGRVLRAVAAGRGDLTCLGCDPNEGAVAWAAEHLPMAEFFVSPQRPPLELADGCVDVAYAVSIWSHFAEAPALEWLDEMHRVLVPGGALVMTTHGLDCLTTQLQRQQVSAETAASAGTAILQGRHHFVDVFGPEGDWGVKDTGWGNAYFSLDWLAEQLSGRWTVPLHWPGALDHVQDVIVLVRS